MEIELLPPAERFRETFLRGLHAFRAEGLPWHVAVDVAEVERDFGAFVAAKLADAERRTETFMPVTHLWAIAGADFVGRISIRHELNDAFRIEGGHIGYDTVPSFRGKGIAKEMLRQALPIARALGLREVMITCDESNVASLRAIERNGGVLRETKALASDRPRKRYYTITLS